MPNIPISRLLLGTLAFAGFVAVAGAQPDLPDGEGKEALQKVCTNCHGLEEVTSNKMTKERWASTVDDMVSRGASATDEQFDQIVNYLAKNFGKAPAKAAKVNVNKGAAADLATLGLSDEEAAAIIEYRKKNGDFKSLDDLKKVTGVDAKKLDAKKDLIEY